MNEQILTVLAELSAQRAILVKLQVLKLLTEPDPLSAALALQKLITAQPTQPPTFDNPFDPATSDLLAGMTDDRIEAVMGDVVNQLRSHMTAFAG
jgi:hypothetical protein